MKTLTTPAPIISRIVCLFILLTFFFSAGIKAAVWTSAANGSWLSGSSWTLVSGSPVAAYPTSLDNVTITTHSINIPSTVQCTSLDINAAAILSFSAGQSLVVYGTFTNLGTLSVSGSANIVFSTSASIPSPVITQTGSVMGNFSYTFRPNGRTISTAAGSTFNAVQLYVDGNPGGGTVNNSATMTANSLFNIIDGAVFNNAANGNLTIKVNIGFIGAVGVFSATGVPNTVTYTGSGWNVLRPTTYYNLAIFNTGVTMATKTLSGAGNLIVNNNFTIASNVQLDCNNKDITVGGTWFDGNSTSSISNTGGTFTFSGATPDILRLSVPEVFGNVVVACTGNLGLNRNNTASYTGSIQCGNLTLQSGTLDLNATGNYTVSVRGNLSNTGGTLNARNGMVNFIGTAAQTISGNTMTFSNMRCANAAGVSTLSAQNLTGTLTMASGTLTSATADFTLISDATTGITGRIAALTAGTVAGARWVVQRRITTGAPSSTTPYWGDYSSPVSGSTLTDWDNEMYMSGVAGADGTACCPTFYSVQQWNNGGGYYSNVTSQIPLVTGYGYSCWTASDLSTFNAFTFDTRGTLNTGSIPVSTPAADYYLLGNPYPSQVLFSALTRANIGNYFWILDETLQDYAYWDGSIGTGKLAGTGGVINSSQGFMVESTGGGTLTFDETDKTTTNVTFVREAAPVNLVRFHFNNNAGRQVGMENMLHFVEGANNEKDLMDMGFPKAPFLKKRYEVKTLTLNGKELCKNTLNSSDPKQEVPVVFKAAEAGNYSFNVDGISNLTGYSCVVLEDMSTGTFVDLSNKKSYSFDCYDNLERHFVLHFTKGKESISCVETSKVFASIGENTQIASNVFMSENGISVLFTNEDVKTTNVTIYNSVGQLVSSEQYVGGGEFIAKRPSQAGIYFVILARDGKTETHKLSVN